MRDVYDERFLTERSVSMFNLTPSKIAPVTLYFLQAAHVFSSICKNMFGVKHRF